MNFLYAFFIGVRKLICHKQKKKTIHKINNFIIFINNNK
jgi:hypothetical protein